jgi:hypothetical protein
MIEGAEDVVKVRRDADFVVEEVVEPKEFLAFGDGDERQEVAQTDANVWILAILVG